jgi:predicted nucleic acid-binding protein
MTVLFLDTNVPMYAAGRPHRLKQPCLEVLSLAAEHPGRFVTDAEVLQEILHRNLSIGRREDGRSLVRQFANLMRGRIEPVLGGDVEYAALLSRELQELTARDLLHASVASRLRVDHLVTADRGFDKVASIVRLDPGDVGSWSRELDLA